MKSLRIGDCDIDIIPIIKGLVSEKQKVVDALSSKDYETAAEYFKKYFQAYREYLQRRFVDKDLYYNCVDDLSKKYGLKPGTFRTKIKLFSTKFRK